MKRILVMICLLLSSEQKVFSDWKLGKIYNQSDLVLDSAWRHKSQTSKRSIYIVTKTLTDALPSQRIVSINYTISQKLGTISILAKNKIDTYDIFFDSHATHSLEWQRKNSQVITKLSTNKSCSIEDGSACARVWMKLLTGSVRAERPTAFYGYDVESDEQMITLNLTIQGKNGSYSLSLAESKE